MLRVPLSASMWLSTDNSAEGIVLMKEAMPALALRV
jgi:hypothetical protein